MLKRNVVLLLVLSLLSMGIAPAFAAYPDKPIHIVVPWAAGGGTDTIARSLVEAMKKFTDVPIVIDNIKGAGGSTGNQKVADASADGYTILFNGDTDLLASLTFMKTNYNLESFKYVGSAFYSPTWILSHADSGIKTFAEFLEKAKANPNQLVLGSTTPAGAQMVMCALLQKETGAPFRIIPSQGGKFMKKALLGNQVNAGIIHAPVLLPEIKAGIINVLAVGGSLKGSSYEPLRSMKTLEEQDIPVSMGIRRGLMVPAGTPDEIVATLSDILEKAVTSDEFKAFGERFGFEPEWQDGNSYEQGFHTQQLAFEKYMKGL